MTTTIEPVGWDGSVNAWRVGGRVYRMGRREGLTEQADGSTVAAHYIAGFRGINERHRTHPDPDPIERHLEGEELDRVLDDKVAALGSFANGLDIAAYLTSSGVTPGELAAVVQRVRTTPNPCS